MPTCNNCHRFIPLNARSSHNCRHHRGSKTPKCILCQTNPPHKALLCYTCLDELTEDFPLDSNPPKPHTP